MQQAAPSFEPERHWTADDTMLQMKSTRRRILLTIKGVRRTYNTYKKDFVGKCSSIGSTSGLLTLLCLTVLQMSSPRHENKLVNAYAPVGGDS
jgi:hypothetical protein